jgi:hypothetical protein
MLPVSLDCPFLIATSVFSKVYLLQYELLTTKMYIIFLAWIINIGDSVLRENGDVTFPKQ